MVKSMTGYGRSRETLHQRDITVEVRSVNNRFLDCTVKMPRAYVFAEDAVKTRVRSAVSRGKVDVFVTIDASAADVSVVTVNEPLARGYFQALTQLKSMFSLEGDVTPMTLAKLPDVLTVTKAEEDLETVAADICQVLDKALAAYNTMRTVEGRRLAEDIAGRLVTIETAVGRVEQQSPQTVAAYRERLEKKMREVLASTTMDEGRILTEAAIFADKVAVDEGDRPPAQPCSPAPFYAGGSASYRQGYGLPDAGIQSRVQHHRIQVQRPGRDPGRGGHEG